MRDEQERAVVVSAERALGLRLDGITPLSKDERRNLILRADTSRGPVIVKATRPRTTTPAASRPSRLVKEWVATAFLARRALGNAPALLAGMPGMA
jgi:hypothetical protein